MTDPMSKRKHILFVEINESSHGLHTLTKASELGYFVTMLTCGLHHYRESTRQTAERCIDRLICMNLYTEMDAILAMIKALHAHHPIDGVYGGSDFDSENATRIASALELPYADWQAVQNARNKYAMREVLQQHSVPQPSFARLEDAGDIPQAVARLQAAGVNFPYIIKPVDSSASDGVALVHSAEQIALHLDKHRNHLHFKRGYYKSPQMMLEKYVQGEIVSVELVNTPSGAVILGLTDRTLSAPPYFVELGGSYPAKLPNEADIIEVALQANRALGLVFGPSHIELVLGPTGPQIIEVNPRLVGSTISLLISAAREKDVAEELMKLYVGDAYDFGQENRGVGLCARLTAPQSGMLQEFSGLEDLQRRKGVLSIKTLKSPGQHLRQEAESNFDLIAEITVHAPTREEAEALLQECRNQLKIAIEAH